MEYKNGKLNRGKVIAEPLINRKSGLYILFIAALFMIATIAEDILFGTDYVSWAYGLAIIAMTVFFAYRIRSFSLLLFGVLVGTAQWHYLLSHHYSTMLSERTYTYHIAATALCAALLIPIIFVTKKRMRVYHRKIFELAGMKISSAENGYTSRPLPAGEIQFSREQITEFAKWVHKRRLGHAIIEDDRVLISISGNMYGAMNIDPSGEKGPSYVIFNFDNTVSVHISREDYSIYTQQFTYDELCASLADVFKQFLEMYHEGREKEIFNKLKAGNDIILVALLMGGVLALFAVGVLFYVFAAK